MADGITAFRTIDGPVIRVPHAHIGEGSFFRRHIAEREVNVPLWSEQVILILRLERRELLLEDLTGAQRRLLANIEGFELNDAQSREEAAARLLELKRHVEHHKPNCLSRSSVKALARRKRRELMAWVGEHRADFEDDIAVVGALFEATAEDLEGLTDGSVQRLLEWFQA